MELLVRDVRHMMKGDVEANPCLDGGLVISALSCLGDGEGIACVVL